ncbi:hypothetical protein [Bradyrhizobium lupini]|uniref:hypothetical protein n=1 Tax=Rhizobium lupini TaxID=136996 RepID=UPI0034C66F57
MGQETHRPEWGNISQIVSALCALALAILAIYGFLFSKTSQAFVSYLQSELALRNIRITSLEQTEKDLQRSIAESQVSLSSLTEQKVRLEGQIADLEMAQQGYAKQVQELGAQLVGTTFSLVREKVLVSKATLLSELDVLGLKIQIDWYDKGLPAQTVRPWQSYLKTLQKKMADLGEADRAMGKTVLDKFVQQCSSLNSVVIQVPAMRVTSSESLSAYDYNIDRHPVGIRAKAIANQIRKAEDDMQACFKSLSQ